jgi:hypothetical protein
MSQWVAIGNHKIATALEVWCHAYMRTFTKSISFVQLIHDFG